MKHSEEPNIVILIIIRLIALPFYMGFVFIGMMVMYFKYIINFVRFGGEAISYTQNMNRKTILEVFLKVAKDNDIL